MPLISNALQAAGASRFFWITLALVLVAATVGYLLTRDRGGSAGNDAKSANGWFPTGRIDFAGPSFEPADADTPASFYLQAEEARILVSLSGIERKEIRWRRATLNEAKRVVKAFHRQFMGQYVRTAEREAIPFAAAEGNAIAGQVVGGPANPPTNGARSS